MHSQFGDHRFLLELDMTRNICYLKFSLNYRNLQNPLLQQSHIYHLYHMHVDHTIIIIMSFIKIITSIIIFV